ncbi:hypothetical protein HK103_000900 [Boothiomyces macroporosus]|uniref:V-SNARE coiled-coil homology domain-containing protein n=1 Tax=Boothiomyces macroporosus TaxID=261099 RepID=A0AAD5UK59_9FUNG|nr:hypothetical protein HK103_000900 [Boothiomyces macroporosus]
MRDLESELHQYEQSKAPSPAESRSSISTYFKRVSWSKETDPEREPLYKSQQTLKDDEIEQVKLNLNEASDAIHGTIGKLLKRGDDLGDIQNKSEELGNVGGMFKKSIILYAVGVWVLKQIFPVKAPPPPPP